MKNRSGFSIVELIIVVVVIAILVTISTITYTGLTAKADFSKAKSDMSSMKKGIDLYKTRNGSYPNTGGNCTTFANWYLQSAKGDAFLPNVKPVYMAQLPEDKINSGQNTYAYCSDGVDFKLLRLRESSNPLPAVETQNNELLDTNSRATTAWGYWSPGAVNW